MSRRRRGRITVQSQPTGATRAVRRMAGVVQVIFGLVFVVVAVTQIMPLSPLFSLPFLAMGALAVDVPELSALNSTKGFSYGKKLLSYITETLDNTFGISSVYRTWDNEFVVLFPDIIQDIFTARCIRVRALMQKRYSGKIRVGYTWAKGVFSAKGLVEEACLIMRCETVERSESFGTENAAGNLASGAGEWNPAERYVPYFQPKVDMRDGSLIGAEALVRGMDQDGKLIMPGRFIESLEQNGKIRELDFFMLESVLKQLAEWRWRVY